MIVAEPSRGVKRLEGVSYNSSQGSSVPPNPRPQRPGAPSENARVSPETTGFYLLKNQSRILDFVGQNFFLTRTSAVLGDQQGAPHLAAFADLPHVNQRVGVR